MLASPDPAAVERFRAATLRLTGPDPGPVGVAVSGGPDSLALLFLAQAAFPGAVQAATVDHGLREAGADEAHLVAATCARLGVPHATLSIPSADVASLRTAGNLQSAARAWRFRLLGTWCQERRLRWLATAHHADDQAETMLMRLARGAGLAGLSGIRARRGTDPTIIRPLLGVIKADLVALCASLGVDPVADPSNDDPRYDRTRARALLAATPWLDPHRLAGSAHHLAESEAALGWTTEQLLHQRDRSPADGRRLVFDLSGLPAELRRRIAAHAIAQIDAQATQGEAARPPRGPELQRLIESVLAGQPATLGRTRVHRDGDLWIFAPAPPHR